MSGDQIKQQLAVRYPFKLNASVEGPYGHAVDYYLSYSNLIVVAGGIGISPFVAILRDLLHRIKRCQVWSGPEIIFGQASTWLHP